MSFILDSLKRAERERRQGETPAADHFFDDASAPVEAPRSHRTWWAALVVTNLALVVILAVFVLRKPTAPEAVRPPAEPAAQQAPAEADANPAVVPAAETPEPVATAEQSNRPRPPAPEMPDAQAVQHPPASRTKSTPTSRVHFGPPVAAQAEDLPSGGLDDSPGPQAASAPAKPSPSSSMTGTPLPDQETSVLAAPLPEAVVALETETLPSPDEASTSPVLMDQVPLLKDMPPDVRAKLRDIKINVLVYADRQEARMVYINSRRYRTGEQIRPGGYLIERILPDGIVLDYGEGKVKIRSGY